MADNIGPINFFILILLVYLPDYCATYRVNPHGCVVPIHPSFNADVSIIEHHISLRGRLIIIIILGKTIELQGFLWIPN